VPNLRIREGGKEYTFQVESDVATLGRGDTNDVDLKDAKASKEHCRLERVGQRWKIVDLESKNGTRVNGEFRNKAWLAHGDEIQIGTAEIRFGVEGASRAARAAPAPASTAMAAGRGAAAPEGDEEAPPPPRRPAKKKDLALILSLALPGVIVVMLLGAWAVRKTSVDTHNQSALDNADELVRQGQYDAAIEYLQKHGDPSGGFYPAVEKRIAELRQYKAVYERNTAEEEAKRLVSKLGIYVLSYNQGHEEIQPEQILAIVERLKTDYAATDMTQEARRQWPAWFAGRVPERASNLLAGSGRLSKDWEETLRRADEFRKEMHFREARETIERFVTEREAVLEAADLRAYQEARDRELDKLDKLADSIYRGREATARRLLTNKRYDEAIAVYREVIEKFGLDYYARKAQAEIEKIEKERASK